MNYLREFKKRYREGLILNTIYEVLKQKYFEINLFYFYQGNLIDGTNLETQPKIEPIEIAHLKPSDMKNLATKAERDYSEDEMLEMLSEGCICIGIKYKDEIISWGWANLKNAKNDLLSISFDLKENEAYIFGMRTLRAFRGKALAPYLRCHTYKYLVETGRTKYCGFIFFSNIPSIRYHRKLNAKPVKLFMNVKFLNKYSRNILLKNYKN